VCYWSQTQTVERLSTRHQTILTTFLGFRKPLYSCTEECATSLHTSSQVHHCMWLEPSPALVLQATNAGVRRPGYEATCLVNGQTKELVKDLVDLRSQLWLYERPLLVLAMRYHNKANSLTHTWSIRPSYRENRNEKWLCHMYILAKEGCIVQVTISDSTWLTICLPGCIEEKWTFGYISAHLRVITTCCRCRCENSNVTMCYAVDIL